MIDYLQGLNEQQREAVLHKDGPLMIVAGAGSGKTKVLTTRIAHLMASGVDALISWHSLLPIRPLRK
jgi:DNA helicase-2/ATP-dependent DNA helicase PcrA